MDGGYVTLLIGRFNASTHSLSYSSAGHHPTGYIMDASGEVKTRLCSTGLPLGISPDNDFPAAPTIPLQRHDLVLMATDGIPEAMSQDGVFFGMERALQVVRTHRHKSAQEIVDALIRAVQDFSHNTQQHDDITAVVVKVQPISRIDEPVPDQSTHDDEVSHGTPRRSSISRESLLVNT
jgi:sigma-B regulation protein RsbU (phosphoserine phosphatase)